MPQNKKSNAKHHVFWYIFLHLLIFFMSLGNVLSKAASQQEFLSLPFILLYLAELFILFSYAILWQQVLKHIPLTVAFCNKAVGMVWTTMWGVLIFKEGAPSLCQCLGIVIVLIGVVLVVTARE
jgi:multidrug transporter EmrE-like cation transporter